jgi:hypothetical protein
MKGGLKGMRFKAYVSLSSMELFFQNYNSRAYESEDLKTLKHSTGNTEFVFCFLGCCAM